MVGDSAHSARNPNVMTEAALPEISSKPVTPSASNGADHMMAK